MSQFTLFSLSGAGMGDTADKFLLSIDRLNQSQSFESRQVQATSFNDTAIGGRYAGNKRIPSDKVKHVMFLVKGANDDRDNVTHNMDEAHEEEHNDADYVEAAIAQKRPPKAKTTKKRRASASKPKKARGGNKRLKGNTNITEYLTQPQSKAAASLQIPVSTLSKRWKLAVGPDRKWPYRKLQKLDREINKFMASVEEDGTFRPAIEEKLKAHFDERNALLDPVWIQM